MSFMINEKIDGGWQTLLTNSLNEWYLNFTYDSLMGNRPLQIDYITTAVIEFIRFMDEYVASLNTVPDEYPDEDNKDPDMPPTQQPILYPAPVTEVPTSVPVDHVDIPTVAPPPNDAQPVIVPGPNSEYEVTN